MASRDTRNRRARLTSAYHELGQQLVSSKLRVVGNYTLHRTIGRGTYGKVRLATHRLTGTRVAVKQIPKRHIPSLIREIHHHRRLHHPHILQLYEVLQTESYVCMVTELCTGGELYDLVVERGSLSECEALHIFGQLCLGVSYIHEQGIVHRDLKLENILLDSEHNVKISDFGFTRAVEPHQWLDTRCGTMAYAPPEMLTGARYQGPAVDIWSLGVILYTLLCGYLPFDDESEAVMQHRIVHSAPELPGTLSPEAHDILTQLLHKDPSQRPSTRSLLHHSWLCTSSAAQGATDFMALLSEPQLPLFQSAMEQRLLTSLADAGISTGQLMHSVSTNACDAAGAFWWLLCHNAKQSGPTAVPKRSWDGGASLSLDEDGVTQRESDSCSSSVSSIRRRSFREDGQAHTMTLRLPDAEHPAPLSDGVSVSGAGHGLAPALPFTELPRGRDVDTTSRLAAFTVGPGAPGAAGQAYPWRSSLHMRRSPAMGTRSQPLSRTNSATACLSSQSSTEALPVYHDAITHHHSGYNLPFHMARRRSESTLWVQPRRVDRWHTPVRRRSMLGAPASVRLGTPDAVAPWNDGTAAGLPSSHPWAAPHGPTTPTSESTLPDMSPHAWRSPSTAVRLRRGWGLRARSRWSSTAGTTDEDEDTDWVDDDESAGPKYFVGGLGQRGVGRTGGADVAMVSVTRHDSPRGARMALYPWPARPPFGADRAPSVEVPRRRRRPEVQAIEEEEAETES